VKHISGFIPKLGAECRIHALMKKVSQLPYDVIASKPVSSFMAEQVVTPEQQILVG
jgi:hypothetical protein